MYSEDSVGVKIATSLIVLVLLAGLVYGVYYLISYRRTATIDVQSRQWSYFSAIKYDTHEIRIVTTTSCSGTGTKRSCTTSMHPETYTVSHTRCSNTSWGDKLPPVAPELSCTMGGGDYREENVSYWVKYLERDQKDTATHTFDATMWDRLQPGARREVVLDIVGNLTGFAKE